MSTNDHNAPWITQLLAEAVAAEAGARRLEDAKRKAHADDAAFWRWIADEMRRRPDFLPGLGEDFWDCEGSES